MPTSIPPSYLPITRYFHTSPSPDTFIPPQTYTSPSRPPHTYTLPSIPPHTYTSLPSPMSPELASMAVDITLSPYPLSSPILSPIDETMVDFVSKLGELSARQPRALRIRRVLYPSAPSAPSTPPASSAPFKIARGPINQLVVYSRRLPKINIKTSSCGTHCLYILIFVYNILYICMILFIYEIIVSCLLNW